MESPNSDVPEVDASTKRAADKASQKATTRVLAKKGLKDRLDAMSDEDKAKIIAFVRDTPALYDMSSDGWKDAGLRARLWQKCGEPIKHNAEEAREAWNRLREVYRKSKKRAEGRSGDGAEDVTVKWRHFESMWFLDSAPDVRKTVTTIDLTAVPEASNNEDANEQKASEEVKDSEKHDEKKSVHVAKALFVTPKSAAKRTRMDPLEEACMELLNRRKESQGDTEDKLFAKLLTKQMERLPDQRKRWLQQHIMKLVSEAIDSEMTNSPQHYSPYDYGPSQPLSTQLTPINYERDEASSSLSSSNGGYYDDAVFPRHASLL